MNQLSNSRKVQRTRKDFHNITCQANISLISLTFKIWLSIECVASKTVTHQKQLHSILIRLLRHVLLETTVTSKRKDLFIYCYNCFYNITFSTIFNILFPHTSKWSKLVICVAILTTAKPLLCYKLLKAFTAKRSRKYSPSGWNR